MLQQFFPKLSIRIKYSMKSESSEMELNVTSETLSDESDVDLEFNNHSLGFEEGDVVTAVPLEDSNAEIKSEKSESELNVTSETLSDDSDVDLEFNNNSLGFMEGGDFDQDDDNASPNWKGVCKRILLGNIFPDDCRYIALRRFKIHVVDSIETVRIVKFVWCTTWMVMFWNVFVKIFGWEHDSSYSIRQFFYFDFGPLVLDCVMFAMVGRLYQRKGVDRLPFIIPAMASCVYGSWSSEIWFLRNSLTLYNMACTWPWQLWLYAAIVSLGISTALGLHIRASIRDSSFVYRLVEMIVISFVFLTPVVKHPSFHLHHYYTFWLLGMHFNREEAWSQFVMAIAWGQYVNGIACWGRDSILTCAYSEHVAVGNYCVSNCDSIQQSMNVTIDAASSLEIDRVTLSTSPFIGDWRQCN